MTVYPGHSGAAQSLDYARPVRRAPGDRMSFSWLVHFAAMGWLLLAFMPIAQSDTLDPGLTPSRIIEIGLVVASTSLVALAALALKPWDKAFDRIGFVIVIGFCGWAFLSAAWAPNLTLSAAKAGELGMITLTSALIGSWAAGTLPRAKTLASMLAIAMFLLICFLLAYNVIAHGTPIPMSGDDAMDHGRPRLMLAFAHPLVGADLMALTMIAIIASGLSLFIRIPMMLMILPLWALTQPRGSAGGFVVAIAAIVLFQIRRRDVRMVCIGALGLIFMALVVITIDNPRGVMQLVVPDDAGTLNGRTEVWRYALGLLVHKPIQGFGYFASRFLLLDVFPWAGHCHNAYIEIAFSTGFIGVAILIVFTVYLVKVALRSRDALLLGAVAYCYSVGILDPVILTPSVPTVVLLIALMHAGARPTEIPIHHEHHRNRQTRVRVTDPELTYSL
jgi:O-antigen ligase